jgi:hypothetical protein
MQQKLVFTRRFKHLQYIVVKEFFYMKYNILLGAGLAQAV